MAIASIQKDSNLEGYSLICLGVNLVKEGKQLRTLINHLKIFDDIYQCEQYILCTPNYNRIILIINDQLGRELIPRIHQLQQISSIYIHCIDEELKHEWIKQYTKIKSIHVHLDDLIMQLRSNQIGRNRNRADEILSISIFKDNADEEKSTTGLDGRFLHSQRLIDCLLRTKPSSFDKDELISLCYEQYQDNEIELNILREFEERYSPDFALWWYTRESFLYKMLNKALRIQNIDIMFLFRFFIRDIQQQLELNQYSSFIRVYRGQLMSTEELKILQNSIGELISVNSFISTSVNRHLALFYLGTTESFNDDIQQILFEVDLNPELTDTKPFADITSHSYFADEQEVLIMLGSIFRVVNIRYDENRVWIIELALSNDHDHSFKSIFDHMKNEYSNGETDLSSIGNVLRNMGQYDKAEKYFHRLLNEMSDNPEVVSQCYSALGKVAKDKGDYDLSLHWHHKSLEMKLNTMNPDNPLLVSTYHSIANIYRRKKQYELAQQWYNKVLIMWKQSFGEDHPNVALCYNNIGLVYQREMKYSEALDYHKKTLIIRQKHFPVSHPHLGLTHTNIANAYRDLGNLDLALEHSTISLNIYKKSLPAEHPQIAWTLDCIGKIYEKMGNFILALSYFEQAAAVFRQTLPSTHYYHDNSLRHIRRVTSQLK